MPDPTPEERVYGQELLKRGMWENLGVDRAQGPPFDDSPTIQDIQRRQASGQPNIGDLRTYQDQMEQNLQRPIPPREVTPSPQPIQLQPIEGNPHAVTLVDAGDNDPFAPAGTPKDRLPGRFQGPVTPVIGNIVQNAVQHLTLPGRVAQGVQPETPGVMTEADAFRLNQLNDEALKKWAPQQALQMVTSPVAPRGTFGSGFRAYHGSPHDFEKFDIGKVGTGEGAASYGGPGIYVAEHPEVAADYKSKLSMLANVNNSADANTALYYLQRNNFDKNAARAELEGRLREKLPDTHSIVQAINDYNPGHMYEVNINADPEHFLHWDKPLSEQSPHVQEALKKLPPNKVYPDFYQRPTASGGEVAPHTPEEVQRFLDAGIPGIKYLDQGSRGDVYTVHRWGSDQYVVADINGVAHSKDFNSLLEAYMEARRMNDAVPKTHNYVVFNDTLIDILKKYGLAGLVAGGAAHYKTQQVDHDPFAQ